MAQTGLVTYAAQEQGGSSMGNGGVYRYVKTGAPPKTIYYAISPYVQCAKRRHLSPF